MVWLPTGFRLVEERGESLNFLQEAGETGVACSWDFKIQGAFVIPSGQFLDASRAGELTPSVALTQMNHEFRSIPLELGTALCPAPTLWVTPCAPGWSLEI